VGIELVGVPAVGERIYVATGNIAPEEFEESRWFVEGDPGSGNKWVEFENLGWILDLDESFAGKKVRVELPTRGGTHFSASAGPIISDKQLEHFLSRYNTEYQVSRIENELKHLQEAHRRLIEIKDELSIVQETPEKLKRIMDLESSIREQTELQKQFADANFLVSQADQLREEMAQNKANFDEQMSRETEALESARREQSQKLDEERKAWGDKLAGQRIELNAEKNLLQEQVKNNSDKFESKRQALVEAEKRFFADTDLVRRLREIESRESNLRERLSQLELREHEFQQKAAKLEALAETLSESKRLNVKIMADAPAGILMSRLEAIDEVFSRDNSTARVGFDRERREQVKSEYPRPAWCSSCNMALNACGCGS